MIQIRPLRQFAKDTRGVSAVEFALIAPAMIFLFFGMVELSQLLQADRKVRSLAATLADVVSRDSIVTAAEMTDIFTATEAILYPMPAASGRARVCSIVTDATATATVSWCEVTGGMADIPDGSPVTNLPAGLLTANQSVVRAEVEFDYSFSSSSALYGSYDLENVAFMRPRRGQAVVFQP